MKKVFMAITLFALGLSTAACAASTNIDEYPSGEWRYKITVEVETPEGVKTGSAVREISAISRPKGMGESNDTHVKLAKGEAVVVDLGGRGVLFALLTNPHATSLDHPIWTVFNAFPSPCLDGAVSRCSVKYYKDLKNTAVVELKEKDFPMLVSFEDINDPKTIRPVITMDVCADTETRIPHSSFCIKEDFFEQYFGKGVSLLSIKVEMAEEPVTWGVVDRYMPSYRPIQEYMKWLRSLKYGDPRRVGPDSFKRKQ
jgi:hypothetical protein